MFWTIVFKPWSFLKCVRSTVEVEKLIAMDDDKEVELEVCASQP